MLELREQVQGRIWSRGVSRTGHGIEEEERKILEEGFTAVRKQRLAVREQLRELILGRFWCGIRLWKAVAKDIAGSSERRSKDKF